MQPFYGDKRTLDGSPVVSERPGAGTGSSVVSTQDGRVWVSGCYSYPITGVTVASIRNEK